MTLKGEAKSLRYSGEAYGRTLTTASVQLMGMIPPISLRTTLITTRKTRKENGTVTEDGIKRFLTGCNNSCAQDDVIRGELDVLYEGAGMLRCPKCEVICSLGKDANSHWKEIHGKNVVGYTCGKCEKKFELLTQMSYYFARCRGQKPASTSGRRFEFRCELCTLGYDSQSGLSQNMRARYSEKFHMRLKVEDNRKQKGYEDAELITLAEAELDLPPDTGYINKALAALGRIE